MVSVEIYKRKSVLELNIAHWRVNKCVLNLILTSDLREWERES